MNVEMDKKESGTIMVRKDHIIWILVALLVLMFIGGMFRHHMSSEFDRERMLRGEYGVEKGAMMGGEYQKNTQEAPASAPAAPTSKSTGTSTLPVPN